VNWDDSLAAWTNERKGNEMDQFRDTGSDKYAFFRKVVMTRKVPSKPPRFGIGIAIDFLEASFDRFDNKWRRTIRVYRSAEINNTLTVGLVFPIPVQTTVNT